MTLSTPCQVNLDSARHAATIERDDVRIPYRDPGTSRNTRTRTRASLMPTHSRSRKAWAALISLAMALGVTQHAQAGSLSWLDEVVQRVVREAEVGGRAVARAEGQTIRRMGRLFAHEAEDSLELAAKRSDELARLAGKVDAPAEAALRTRFQKVVQPDAAMVRTFEALAPAEKHLVVEMSEAAHTIARRYPGQAEIMVRRLGIEGLSATRAFGDDVAEVIVKQGPESIDVLRKTGRTGWTFFTESVLPHKGKLVAAGVFALFLANPEKFVDTTGQATQFAVEQFAKAGIQLAGAVGAGIGRGLERAVGGTLEAVGLNHALLRWLIMGAVALAAVAALLVVLGLPLRLLLSPFTWPLRLAGRMRLALNVREFWARMSNRLKERLDRIEDRLTGPKRVALFGHRAVGKTTLLSIFYREASNGRVPNVRLAAGDAATADYLADKIAQIESGSPPAGTLSETPLRLHLYHGPTRLDLIVKDYQGEHVGLGSDAPIFDFFADCDAVLLCLDGQESTDRAGRQRRQQEIEALLERYLESSGDGTAGRPVALLVTKYDRVLENGGPPPDRVEELVESSYGMTQHALATHAPRSALFAVSSYGTGVDAAGHPPATLHPLGLEGPLGWLASQLEAVDHDRLEWLFDLAPDDTARLERCLDIFDRRYPHAAQSIHLRRRNSQQKRKTRWRSLRNAAASLVAAAALLAGYDAWGFYQTRQFEQSGAAPIEVERRWARLLDWHPTLAWFFPGKARTARIQRAAWEVKAAAYRVESGIAPPSESERMRALRESTPEVAEQFARLERAEDRARMAQAWKELRVADIVAIENPAGHLASVRKFLRDFPDNPYTNEAVALARGLEQVVSALRARDERQTIDALARAAALPDASFRDLIEQARLFLDEHPESPYRSEVAHMVEQWRVRLDEADIERARQFSRSYPTNFPARRQKYLDYLNTHSEGGRFVSEANQALAQIDAERDTYLYKQAFDYCAAHPNDVPAVAERLQAYLQANPHGRFARPARDYITWWEKISVPGDYRVVLRRGKVEPTVGKPLAGAGPDLGVSLWVGAKEYGPSPVIKDSREPVWDYTFPTPIRWKYGDQVTIRIVDHDWSPSGVFTLTTPIGDKLAMRLLSGTVRPSKGGRTELVFSSNFQEPRLPRPE